jgi:hypothetical protein
MKIARPISIPERIFTGQSTTSVKAPFLAAANAFVAPAVSSDVPVHETQPLIDFLTVAAAELAGGGVVEVVALELGGVAGALGVEVLAVPVLPDVAELGEDVVLAVVAPEGLTTTPLAVPALPEAAAPPDPDASLELPEPEHPARDSVIRAEVNRNGMIWNAVTLLEPHTVTKVRMA